MRPVLIWGRHGLLAQSCRRTFFNQTPFLLWGRGELPSSRAEQRRKVCLSNPLAIVNASGFTNLRQAEMAPQLAWELHVEIPAFLACLSRDLGIPFATVSSDYVFSGKEQKAWRESDTPEPVNAYGKSKLEGERAVTAVNPQAKIIRTAGIFGPALAGGKVSFPERIFRQVKAGKTPGVRTDLTTSICHVDDLAKDLWQILWQGSAGIFHVAHHGSATWYQIAETALKAAGLPSHLKPTASPDFPRPPCSVLGTEKVETRTGHARRKSWQDALSGFMRKLSQ